MMRTRRGRSPTSRNDRHDPDGQPDTIAYRPARIVRKGMTRRPTVRTAADRPPTPAQQQVLELLTSDHQRAADLAGRLDRPASGVVASLYALADRGLAELLPYVGWRRA